MDYTDSVCPTCGSVDIYVADGGWECADCYDARREPFSGPAQDLKGKITGAIPLSYYECGLCRWSVAGPVRVSDLPGAVDRWSGVWVPDRDTEREAADLGLTGQDLLDWMAKRAEGVCRVYSAYLNGQVFGFFAEVYTLRTEGDDPFCIYDQPDDYRFSSPVASDSCGGFFELDHLQDELNAFTRDLGVVVKVLY